MRRRVLLPLAAALAACAPKPCTKALCPVASDGYEIRGVKSVAAPAGTPLPAVPPDGVVEVSAGRSEFKVSRSRVFAEAGASFRFFLSSGTPALDVTSGPVSVARSSEPAAAVSGVIMLQ
jgi:hypothetical protein